MKGIPVSQLVSFQVIAAQTSSLPRASAIEAVSSKNVNICPLSLSYIYLLIT
jgi:hypothetical protein